MVMMHGLGFPLWRQGHFEHPHKSILENNLVTIGRCLYGVIAFGEARLILSSGEKSPSTQGS